MNQPHIVNISSTINETTDVKTISFPYTKPTKAGQFFMIWIPGVDEIPMSVSMISENEKSITFKIVGDATKKLFTYKKNDSIGIRGPYGNGFSYTGSRHLFIGGGTGIAMIAPAVEQCVKRNEHVDVILGAKTSSDLFFLKRLQQTNATIHITTDDGTMGHKGYTSHLAENIIKKKQIDTVYTCGPEHMMYAIMNICRLHNISLQASLERYMKCAVGICGQCCIGQGQRVCIDGPIFDENQLITFEEFGQYTRTASGKKKKI